MQPDLGQLLPAPGHGHDHGLPAREVDVLAHRLPPAAALVELRRTGLRAELVPAEGVVRQETDCVVLHDEVTEPVEDRLALVELDALVTVRTVAHDDVRARINGLVGHLDEVIGRVVGAVPVEAAVQAEDHPVGYGPGLTDLAEVGRPVAGVHPRRPRYRFPSAKQQGVAARTGAEVQVVVAFRPASLGETAVARLPAVGGEPEFPVDGRERLERRVVHGVDRLHTDNVGARPAADPGPPVGSTPAGDVDVIGRRD